MNPSFANETVPESFANRNVPEYKTINVDSRPRAVYKTAFLLASYYGVQFAPTNTQTLSSNTRFVLFFLNRLARSTHTVFVWTFPLARAVCQ